MPEASVDAVVCDPPYGLEFMGREWDSFKPGDARLRTRIDGRTNGAEKSTITTPEAYRAGQPFQAWCEAWGREALRVLKPGGHLLAFGGSRTSHRLVCGLENAGFEVRDTIMWLYGSGFPKSLDVSKAIDKAAGAERVKGTDPRWAKRYPNGNGGSQSAKLRQAAHVTDGPMMTSDPTTPDAKRRQGWGTALKPAHEPIVFARKPLSGTVAATVLEHGTGALNIDGCRVDVSSADRETWERAGGWMSAGYVGEPSTSLSGGVDGSLNRADANRNDDARGRWPANVVLSHSPGCREVGKAEHPGFRGEDGTETVAAWGCVEGCAVRMLDEQTGQAVGGNSVGPRPTSYSHDTLYAGGVAKDRTPFDYGDTGGASRFFYCPKADTAERNAGLSVASLFSPLDAPERNAHPTVKPMDLMRWLVRLVTPPGGAVLDPFAGSGTTLCAAVLEGFDCIGIEREAEYVAIVRARLAHWASGTAEMPESAA